MADSILSRRERAKMQDLIAHPHDARQTLRAYALLWLDDGESVPEVAQRLGVTRQTVYNWASRFQARTDLELDLRLLDAPRCGRPCTATGIIDPLIEAVIERDPREFDYRSTIWTAPLLVEYLRDEHKLMVSDDSVRLAIARLRVRWKRPRHQLALRPQTWRQAKGG
ncbi:MAG TPA: helix-turn-helix domain-containing protein [Pyrinomonadaceae bacterium]|nr:helix-turn-helix domain-containing protein [Pyrinomonadaceae bacterium]